MKAVPSVLRYLGKCTAGFSSNCVPNLRPMQVALSIAIAYFSWNCAQTSPNYEDSTPLVGRARRLEVAGRFSHYLTLNWISVN